MERFTDTICTPDTASSTHAPARDDGDAGTTESSDSVTPATDAPQIAAGFTANDFAMAIGAVVTTRHSDACSCGLCGPVAHGAFDPTSVRRDETRDRQSNDSGDSHAPKMTADERGHE